MNQDIKSFYLNIMAKRTNIKHDMKLLEKLVIRDQFTLKDTKYDKLHYHTKIEFVCVCGIEGFNRFSNINRTGGFCKNCMAKNKVEKFRNTNLVKYGTNHPMKTTIVQDKIKQTNLEKYGYEYPLLSKEIQDKVKQTNLKNHGYEYPFQSKEIQNKCSETLFTNYGVSNASQADEVKEKKKTTTFKNYGVEYPGQSEEIKDRIKKTNIIRYGGENPMHDPVVVERQMKNAFKYKDFTYPDGTIIKAQGYEYKALNILVEQGYKSTDIITDKTAVPKINYIQDNNIHRYYCDIYLPSINKIIEVKSIWTYVKEFKKNMIKEQACRDQGFNFEFWVFNTKKLLSKQEVEDLHKSDTIILMTEELELEEIESDLELEDLNQF